MYKTILAFAVLAQIVAFLEMPVKCFSVRYIGTCERVQLTAWVYRYDVSWESVNALRTFGS